MSALHMVRLSLPMPELLRRVLSDHPDADVDYGVHTELRRIFGEDAPQPFRCTQVQGREVTVLGYARKDGGRLEAEALSLGWSQLRSKPMPELEAGRRLGFEVRVCPVVRKASAGEKHRKGAEVDRFLAECWRRPGEPVSREAVYTEWLRGRLDDGGAALEVASLVRFRRARMFRRAQGAARKGRLLERPDAVLSGELVVRDAERFRARVLERGVGRHRAFGFGMVLLRAVRC